MRIINKAIFVKVFKDNLSFRNILIYLLIVSVPSLFFASLSQEAKMFSDLSLELKTEYLSGMFLIFSFFWLCGIALIMLSSFICSGFVAEEVSEGTMPALIAKPVSRMSILISKFTAFAAAISIFSFISLIFSAYLWISLFDLGIYSIGRFVSFIPMLFGYSVFISLLFGSIATAFSVISSSRMKALLPVIGILMLTFFALLPVRTALINMKVYQNHAVSLIDLGYDLGNLYIGLLEGLGVRLIPPVQNAVGGFTGVYKIPPDGVRIDYDHGFILPNLEKTAFRSPAESLSKWIFISLAVLCFSFLIFQRRDIN